MYKQLIVHALLLAGAITSAHATTLEYIGPEFDFTSSTPLIGERVSARVTFSTPLTPGTVLTLADTSSFTLSAAGREMTNETASFAMAKFYIGVDGLPRAWGFGAEQDIEGEAAPEQITTRSLSPGTMFAHVSGPFYSDFIFFDDGIPGSPRGRSAAFHGRVNGVIDSSWTVVPVPEPMTLILLALGCPTYISWARRNRVF